MPGVEQVTLNDRLARQSRRTHSQQANGQHVSGEPTVEDLPGCVPEYVGPVGGLA